MRLLITITAVALFVVIVLAACNSNEQLRTSTPQAAPSASPPPPPPGDNARRITAIEAKQALADNSAVLVDVRGDAAYKDGHIKGARSIPYADILAHVDELPSDKTIITYCS